MRFQKKKKSRVHFYRNELRSLPFKVPTCHVLKVLKYFNSTFKKTAQLQYFLRAFTYHYKKMVYLQHEK